jgi:hypothetical protein
VSKMFFAVFSVATLTLTSLAQTKAPQPSRHYKAIPGPRAQAEPDGHLAPRLCNPCLFYGGNLDVPNIDSAGLSDENTLNISDSHTYGAVAFPAAVSVTGLLFQVQMSAHMNPKEATWEIRRGVSSGNGGTVVASGTAAATMKPTGRVFIGLGEYTVGVKFPAVSLAAGTYWFNVTPQCTDSSDVQCTSFATRYFVSNTVRQQQNLHGSWQPIGDMFLNSSFFGLDFINWCDPELGLDANQCSALSFGVIGTRD